MVKKLRIGEGTLAGRNRGRKCCGRGWSEKRVKNYHASQLRHIPPYLRDSQIVKHKLKNPRVTLNVGGERHEVMWTLLQKHHTTRLGKLSRAFTREAILALADDYNLEENEYYFDRHPRTFNNILNFYRTGEGTMV